MTGLLVVACALVGLAVGSFLNVVIWRVPREESVVRPRSHCPACGAQLAERDNIPVVSWLLLRGRCRSCGQRISARYPLVELLAAVVFVATAVRFGADWVLPAYLVFFAGLVALSAIDLDLHRLPNRVLYPTLFATAPLLVLASAAAHRWGNLARAAEGGVLCFAILLAIHLAAPRGMGFGDVRLAGLIGMATGWLGVGHSLLALFAAFLFSAVIGIALIVSGLRGRRDRIPFGPFLALGALVAVLWGTPLLHWYGV
ncbi:MAG TPA: prepilin peptidase [Acidimicrobiales bacterium]|nr:prepilin peptidase [Acidimicrobiales bacterium]